MRPNNRSIDPMMGTVLILTNGKLATVEAKTAHGLIRGTTRFEILGVVDPEHAGRDAGEVLDGRKRNIPVFATLADYLRPEARKPDYCIIGVAVSGGRLTADWDHLLKDTLRRGLSLINTMHRLLGDNPELVDLARENGAEIIDVRRPKPTHELHFWTGEVLRLKTPIVAVLGLDCALGKRTTCRLILEMCRAHGIRAEMIYTGQTGWLEGCRHGFIFDATLNDFRQR